MNIVDIDYTCKLVTAWFEQNYAKYPWQWEKRETNAEFIISTDI